MKLKAYIVENDLTLEEFCTLIDYSTSYIRVILSGHKKPGAKVIRKIKAITDGKVDILAEYTKRVEKNKAKKEEDD